MPSFPLSSESIYKIYTCYVTNYNVQFNIFDKICTSVITLFLQLITMQYNSCYKEMNDRVELQVIDHKMDIEACMRLGFLFFFAMVKYYQVVSKQCTK